jgi:hypothetical protein
VDLAGAAGAGAGAAIAGFRGAGARRAGVAALAEEEAVLLPGAAAVIGAVGVVLREERRARDPRLGAGEAHDSLPTVATGVAGVMLGLVM